MLDSLKIRNFRMLSDFEVPKLGNVNLIVGKNNSGKSTVLEALRIFAAKGNPRSLMEIAIAHGEISANQARPESEMDEENTHPFRDFFYGRQFPGDDSSGPIYIGDRSEQDFVKIAHTLFVEEYEKITQGDGEEASVRKRKIVSKDDIGPDVVNAEQALIVSLSEVPHVGWICAALR
jgi:AAA15 family ATPase/GTPase